MALISADDSETLPSARRVLRSLAGEAGYGLGLTLLATAAVAVAVSDGSAWLATAILSVISAAGIVQLGVPGLRPVESLGHLAVPRTAAIAAVSLLLIQTSPSSAGRWTVALTAGAALGMVLLEPIMLRAVGARQAFTAQLPGVSAVPKLTSHAHAYVIGSFILPCWGAAIAALGWPVWLWSIATTALLGFYGAAGSNAYRRAVASRAVESNLNTALRQYAPDFIIYTARPDDASYQVAMWLPYLQRTGKKFIIVTRSLVPAEALAAMTDAPVVMRRRVADLDDVVVPSVNAVFYVNASSGNGAMVRFHELTHVYLGHGDSDKPPSYNPTHGMYDRIFAAGEAATRRYAEHGVSIPRDKFQIVGRPQLENVQPARLRGTEAPVVLYAPTWRGHVEETFFHSLPVGEKIVRSLMDRGSTVIFRPHPFSYEFPEDAALIGNIQELLREDAQSTGRKHLWGAEAESVRGIVDCINASDAMVSDVSSVVSDYLYSGKPFAMVAVNAAPEDFVHQYPIARASYVLEGGLSNVDEVLDSLLGADEMAGVRSDLRSDYLGDFPVEGYTEVFIEAARTIASTRPSHAIPSAAAEPEVQAVPAENGDAPDEADDRSASGRRRLLALLRFVLPAAGAVVTWCAYVLAASGWLVGTAGLATVAISLFFHRRAFRRRRALNAMLGNDLAARALLVLALLLQLGSPAWTGTAAWLTAGLVCWLAATSLEEHAATAWRPRGLDARNLPGINTQGHEILPRGSAAVLSIFGLGAGFVTAYFSPGTAPVAAGVMALLLLAFSTKVLGAGWWRSYRNLRHEAELSQTVERLAPEFALYFGSNVGAGYQAGMWLPYLDRIGRPYIVITRTLRMMRAIAALTEAPVVHRPTLRSLEEVVPPSLKVAFYVNNAVKNTHFIERREMRHVWLNHGDSEKPACYNPVHAIYDHLFSAGQAGVDRYARHGVEIPGEKFRIVGRPQVEGIQRRLGVPGPNPTVLYAPTWRGPYADSAVYSLPSGRGIVEGLLARGCTVIFRAHPFNYRFPEAAKWIAEIGDLLAADAAATGRQHIFGKAAEQEMSVVDCFNASDAMVSDVSAMVSDYLQSGKPFSIVSVGRTVEELAAEAPASRAAYVIEEDLGNLDQALDDLLVQDPLAAQREESRVYYLGDFPAGSYADGFLTAARELIDAPRRPL
ncbi:CDP-glycerol glycerophosphotransferase family protein [Arthrobacter sulfonylureivorans]|uniref:CDP-glycerol glycerophosphotransferase family protein n=1 Tax=Arthrobacter sulfonylureivorans TaxID=2486855 RepID=A0ABY3WIF8_9MICC|nr:CDP-glycerol glycerophosphotransferase family protein [Arthrobacter sulfonylureivorans]UNK47449.1 CDP-glycerol glycerophosphotransferase family protein [Arthrobacter sulfonylureivorans]